MSHVDEFIIAENKTFSYTQKCQYKAQFSRCEENSSLFVVYSRTMRCLATKSCYLQKIKVSSKTSFFGTTEQNVSFLIDADSNFAVTDKLGSGDRAEMLLSAVFNLKNCQSALFFRGGSVYQFPRMLQYTNGLHPKLYKAMPLKTSMQQTKVFRDEY